MRVHRTSGSRSRRRQPSRGQGVKRRAHLFAESSLQAVEVAADETIEVGKIPHGDGAVTTGREQSRAVGTEFDGEDHVASSRECQQVASTGYAPQANRSASTAAREQCAVGREREAEEAL